MHRTAMLNAKRFFDAYVLADKPLTVVDIGAQDVNGSLKALCPPTVKYIGVDFVAGTGVDVVLDDPYRLPFADGSIDAVVSSSCFEHSEMFWLLFVEVLRVLRPAGLLYLNVPSNGQFHRWPVDCWRFYPDSGRALVTWAKRCGLDPALLESFVAGQDGEWWNDFVAVFVKDAARAGDHPRRIVDRFADFRNATVLGRDGILNETDMTEDLSRLQTIQALAERKGRPG